MQRTPLNVIQVAIQASLGGDWHSFVWQQMMWLAPTIVLKTWSNLLHQITKTRDITMHVARYTSPWVEATFLSLRSKTSMLALSCTPIWRKKINITMKVLAPVSRSDGAHLRVLQDPNRAACYIPMEDLFNHGTQCSQSCTLKYRRRLPQQWNPG